jgi:hypothetical protein
VEKWWRNLKSDATIAAGPPVIMTYLARRHRGDRVDRPVVVAGHMEDA